MPEKDHLILTAAGPDRVGLVEKISEFISRRGGNIEDSRMAAFYGEFAIIVLVSGDGDSLSTISSRSKDLEMETGLIVRMKTPGARESRESFLSYKLTASCKIGRASWRERRIGYSRG